MASTLAPAGEPSSFAGAFGTAHFRHIISLLVVGLFAFCRFLRRSGVLPLRALVDKLVTITFTGWRTGCGVLLSWRLVFRWRIGRGVRQVLQGLANTFIWWRGRWHR